MDRHTWGFLRLARSLFRRLANGEPMDSKEQRYGRGPVFIKPTAPFFPPVGTGV